MEAITFCSVRWKSEGGIEGVAVCRMSEYSRDKAGKYLRDDREMELLF